MNKVIIVTGVCGQIGTRISKKLLNEGHYVIGVDLKNTTPQIKNANFAYYRVDITSKKNVDDFFQNLKINHKTIDGLVNNAGTAVFSKFEERTEDELVNVTKTNIFGPIFMVQNFIQLAPRNNTASIVNLGSIYGIVAPDQNMYKDTPRNSSEIYGMTKAATINFTKYLSVYLKDLKIRCNCVSPGGVLFKQGPKFIKSYSNKVPLKRMANVDEIVEAIIFLLDSSKSSYINGTNLLVDGGFTAWR